MSRDDIDLDDIDLDDVAADIEAAAEEDSDYAELVDDDDGAYDRAYDMWLDRKLGID